MSLDIARNAAKLNDLARRINNREEEIEELKESAIEKANQTVCEALLQGQDLISAKALCPHGEWLDWCAAHCPKLSVSSINKYMRLALKYPEHPELLECKSLRSALALLEDAQAASKNKQPKAWPVFQEALGKAWKFVEYVQRHPIREYPMETIESLRSDLLPIAEQLWPDRFDQTTPTPHKESIPGKSEKTGYQTSRGRS